MSRLNICGETIDGKLVAKGFFDLFDTHGIPLSIIWGYCKEYDIQPEWRDFYQDGIGAGWNYNTIINRLKESIVEIYGEDYWIQVEQRLTVNV